MLAFIFINIKHFKFFNLTNIGRAFYYLLSRDDELIAPNETLQGSNQVELKYYNQIDFGFAENFCERESNNPPVFALVSGDEEGIKVLVENSQYRIYPFVKFDGSTAIIVNDGANSYIGYISENPYLLSKTETATLPNEFGRIREINYQGNFDILNVAAKVEENIGVSNMGSAENPEYMLTDDDIGADITWVKECDYILVFKVENFVSVFYEQGDASHIEGFIEDAFNSCPPAYPDYQANIPNRCLNYCIDPRCVVDYLLNIITGLSEYQKRVLVSRYLEDTLGLTNDEQNWLTFNDQSDLLYELYNQLGSDFNEGECDNEDCSMKNSLSDIVRVEKNEQSLGLSNLEVIDLHASFFCCGEDIEFNVLGQLSIDNQPLNYSGLSNIPFCDDSYLPECEGCSVGQKGELWIAWSKLKCAKDKLRMYDGTTPSEIAALINSHFNSDSKFLARFLANIYAYIKIWSVDSDYQPQNNGEGNCGSNTLAWTYPVIQFTDIRLCDPNFWNASSEEQASTLIHKWMHLYYFAGDIAYDWEDQYDDLSTVESLFNADSFAELVSELCI